MASVSSCPADLSWCVYAGDRNSELFEFLTVTDPWDITGAVVTAQARVTAVDPLPALTAVCTVVDPVNGLVTVAWDGEEVRTLLAGADRWTGVWDLQIVEQGQTLPRTMARGAITAVMDVTRTATP
jgi:hypothetical protein